MTVRRLWTEVLCQRCGGNGVVTIPGGVSECPRCEGRCYDPAEPYPEPVRPPVWYRACHLQHHDVNTTTVREGGAVPCSIFQCLDCDRQETVELKDAAIQEIVNEARAPLRDVLAWGRTQQQTKP